MAKITNKQTRPSAPVVLDAEQVQIRDNARACFAADDAGNESLTIFADLFGAARDFDSFESLRKLWVAEYQGQGATPEAARQAFSYRMKQCGLKKPENNSPEAMRKREARAAKKASEASTADEGDESTPKDGAGARAAAKVQMELSAIEAHIVALLRAGKYEMAAECIANEKDKAALI